MADTASLVVRVISQGVSQASRELDRLTDSSGKAESSLGKMTAVAATAAAAYTAVSGAISAMVLASAKAAKETENLARQARLSTKEFKALEFAANQYGVTGEQVADISKDIADKLGEFATAGTGPFQDFLDVMGMTKQQGVALAREMQHLSGDQVVGELVRRMEEAGASGNQMTFVLESMGNDLSKLIPLYANNSSELRKLKGAFNDINGQIAITAEQSAELKKVSASYDLMTKSVGNATQAISATLAPSMNEFFNSVIAVVPTATQKIIDFINTFQDAENIKSIADMDKQIEALQQRAKELESFRGVSDVFGSPADISKRQQLVAAEERLNELYHARLELQKDIDKSKLADASTGGGGLISGGGAGTAGVASAAKDTAIENQAKQAAAFLEQLRQANLNEMQLIDVQQQEKVAKLDEYKALGLLKEQEYQDALTNIQTTAVLARAELETQMLDEQSKMKDQMRRADLARAAEEERRRQKTLDDGIDAQRNMTANLKSSLGEQSSIYKASAIATATIDTYKAATGAYSAMASIPYVGPILGAAAAGAAIVAGLANVAAIRGAREQGGSMIGGGAYQMVERGKAEVVVPAGASRARTAAQMRDIMGQNGSQQAPNFTIVNQTQGRIDNVSTERQSDGSWLLRIEEFMSEQALDPDSMFSKALRV